MKVETSKKKNAAFLVEQKKKPIPEKINDKIGSKKQVPVNAQILSERDLMLLSKHGAKSRLPFVYLENRKSEKKFLYRSLVPDFSEWRHCSSDANSSMKNGFLPGSFDLFLKLPDTEKAVFVASGSEIISNKLNENLIVSWALDSAGLKGKELKLFNIVALAGLFHSGLLFPKDEQYAKDILSFASDQKETQYEMQRQLIISTFESSGLPLVKSLLSLGADPNCHDEEGSRPLTLALYRGHYEIAKLLIEHGASVTEYDIAAGGSAVSYIEDDVGYDSSSSLDRLIMKGKAREEKEAP